MNAVIRLDDKGSPYLIVNYEDREGNEQSASDDAERLFFTHLNQNGGLLHLVPDEIKEPTQSADLTNDSVIPSSTVVDPDEGGDAFPR
ncbi:unnamed protein product [Sphagnum balticum]